MVFLPSEFHRMRQLNLSLVQGSALMDSRHFRLHLRFQITKRWQFQSFIIHSYPVNTYYVNNNQRNHGEIQNIYVAESRCESDRDNLTLCTNMTFEIYPFWFSSKLTCRQFDAIIPFSLHSSRAEICQRIHLFPALCSAFCCNWK